MGWTFSQFGEQLGRGSGIGELMDDLGHALAVGGNEVCMLGGGQPAHLPELDAVWRRRCQELLDDPGRFEAVVGNYEPPLGNQSFRESIAELLKRRYGWDLSFKNVAVTAGGQTGLFFFVQCTRGTFRWGSTPTGSPSACTRVHRLRKSVSQRIPFSQRSPTVGTNRGSSVQVSRRL